jgi:hypothetical protein
LLGGAPGTGMYVDMSTAQQMSGFSITSQLVTCAVGTFGVGQLALSGPFSMHMYSTSIASYSVNAATHTINATGRMRSITMIVAGLVTENVEHDFIAITVKQPGHRDRPVRRALRHPVLDPGPAATDGDAVGRAEPGSAATSPRPCSRTCRSVASTPDG